jgi:hypothetical protein
MKTLTEKLMQKKKENMVFTIIEDNDIDEMCADDKTVSSVAMSEGQCYIYELNDTYVDVLDDSILV